MNVAFGVLVNHCTVTPGGGPVASTDDAVSSTSSLCCGGVVVVTEPEPWSDGVDIFFFLQSLAKTDSLQNCSCSFKSPNTQPISFSTARLSLESCTCALLNNPNVTNRFLSWTASKTESSSQHALIQQNCLSHSLIISRLVCFLVCLKYSSILTCVLLYSSAQLASRAYSTSVKLRNHL